MPLSSNLSAPRTLSSTPNPQEHDVSEPCPVAPCGDDTAYGSAEQNALASNVTFKLIVAVGPLYVVKRTPDVPIEMHASDHMASAKTGALRRHETTTAIPVIP